MNIRIAAVGDIVLQYGDPDPYFVASAPVTRASDVAIGQIEVPHTTETDVTALTVPSPPSDPAHLRAMADAGYDIGTVAGNHVFDLGTKGVLDTLSAAHEAGIVTTGTGANLAAAMVPAIVERKGVRVGVLSFNCVGPRESWATSKKAGSAFVKVLTHYDLDDLNPGNPPQVYTFADRRSLQQMTTAIESLRSQVDVVVVALHKGYGHTPARIDDYEYEIAHAAIDAGADAVVGHHSHIMRGIEMYRGKAIFHGLGNFVTVTDALTPSPDSDSEELKAWARRRVEMYGFSPDPDMPGYPFHPESRNTAIAILDVDESGIHAGFIPCWIDGDAAPVPLARGERDSVADYIEDISRRAGLQTRFEWEGDVVRVS
ncbi:MULTISPECIES: CapA family protein [Microbacterium]|uniref:CapA family protein n=1 Tax=Microbacterium wangchenii TaxID=2541726 RepID=A0ABX5SXC1_9MICO|nr:MULTISPECIES: CapA family protein [Microbacterium]MCK6067315.1 CapA family protein [Microbacterium sp. EYE_512]QBR89743.1 CapA family protein [Microbacterium wangchenii]TFV85398.1 CapA family protein [Microbacterium sp. dk485]TXK16659.1 CapA family protein [Microbacterium wangchenii]